MRHRLMLAIVLLLVSLAEQQTSVSGAQGTTYTDPFAYCAAVGTIDAPDARYTGPQVPDVVVQGLQAALQRPADTAPGGLRTGSSWRCMEGQVYACWTGANLPCQEQANTSQTPTTAMADYCRANADAAMIPGFVTGGSTIYEWRCQNGVATPGRQVWQVDARGFIADIWHAISPEAAGAQTMPRTGGAPAFGGSAVALVVLGAMAALFGLVARRRSVVH